MPALGKLRPACSPTEMGAGYRGRVRAEAYELGVAQVQAQGGVSVLQLIPPLPLPPRKSATLPPAVLKMQSRGGQAQRGVGVKGAAAAVRS